MREDMIVNSHLHKIAQSLEMKADMDGEMRLVMAEMVLEIDLEAYEEKKLADCIGCVQSETSVGADLSGGSDAPGMHS